MQTPVVRSFQTDGRPGAEKGHPCYVPGAARGRVWTAGNRAECSVEGRVWFPTTWEGELVGGGARQPVYSLSCGRAGGSGLYLREMEPLGA